MKQCYNCRYCAYMDLQTDLDSMYLVLLLSNQQILQSLLVCMLTLSSLQICSNHEFNFLCSTLNGNSGT